MRCTRVPVDFKMAGFIKWHRISSDFPANRRAQPILIAAFTRNLNYNLIAYHELAISELLGVTANDGAAVWQAAEHASGIFASNARHAAAADRVSQDCTFIRVWLCQLHGSSHVVVIEGNHHCLQLLPRTINFAQVAEVGIAQAILQSVYLRQ